MTDDIDLARLAAVLRRVEELDMHDIAQEIAAAGVRVAPTVPGMKDPMLERGHIEGCEKCRRAKFHGTPDQGATLDSATIRRYWSVHPDAGVGMKDHPRLLRGDGDHPDKNALIAARKALCYGVDGEPLPFGTSTPGGTYRRRYIHLQPEGQTLGGGGTLALGISWYGTSGYVVVAGRHPSGASYKNFHGAEGITPAPVALVAVLQQCSNRDGAPGVQAASSDRVTAFISEHCGTENMALLQRRRKIVADARNGERHHTALAQLTIGFKEAAIGLVPAASVRDVVRDGLAAAGWEKERFDEEFDGLVSWAVAQVEHLDPETIRADKKARLDKALTKDREPDWDDSDLAARDLNDGQLDAIEATVPTTKRGPGRPATATELVALAETRYRFAQADDGRPFAVPLDGPAIAVPLDGTRASLRAELAAAYYAKHDKTPSRSALIDALAVLEGRAASVERERLALRFAHDDDRVVIDLGDASGAAVIIDNDGWRITDRPPVIFRRTELTGALPRPVEGGDLDLLLEMLNVRLEDWLLLVAWIVACALDLPRPILLLIGEQGTGKTTAARLIVSTIDPSPVPVRAAPKDVEGWIVSAAGSAVVAIDNLSAIAEWLSDALCRAATGEGLVRRQLYTDGGLAVTSFRRSVILTSIDPGALRGDLAERLLPIELEPIPAEQRRTDADVAAHFTNVHGQVLGVLLELIADVLRALPAVELDQLPRMADFARVLAAIDVAHGSQVLARYIEVTEDVAQDLIESDPLAGALIALSHQDWTGTAAELCASLEPFHQPGAGAWPRTPKTMSTALSRHAPSLRRAGVTVERWKDDTRRMIRLGRCS